jgi:hypothetical protein
MWKKFQKFSGGMERMTDEELITRLRDLGLNSPDIAADRIEQLLKDAEVANDAINHWIVAYNNIEAKLAKAVEALRDLRDKFGLEGGIYEVLKELENYNG